MADKTWSRTPRVPRLASGARARRARRQLRVLARRSSKLGHLDGIEFERSTGDVADRRAVPRAMAGVTRVFNVVGRTSLRAADHEAVLAAKLRAPGRLRGGARGRGRASSRPRAPGRSVARPRGPPMDDAVRDRPPRAPYVNCKHEAELEAFRLAARGLPVRIVNPPSSSARRIRRVPRWARAPLLPRADPRLRRRGAEHRRRPRCRHRSPACRPARGARARYILGGRNLTLDRLFADLARISGVPPPR